MLAAPYGVGVGFYGFYAMQPYVLELYGRRESYAIAALSAAIVAGAQIVGGFAVPFLNRMFRLRTSALIAGTAASAATVLAIGLTSHFSAALVLLAAWGVVFSALVPVRQAYLNGIIPSAQRATVLSSENLLGSTGGVVVQPALGRVADVWGYSVSYVVSAGVELLAIPFMLLARRARAASDPIEVEGGLPARSS
jgi:MFS family permease